MHLHFAPRACYDKTRKMRLFTHTYKFIGLSLILDHRTYSFTMQLVLISCLVGSVEEEANCKNRICKISSGDS